MIFVSTGGETKRRVSEVVNEFISNGIEGIELSGGMYYQNIEKEIIELGRKARLQVHNYFPPPKIPFVLNLASANVGIKNKSIEFIKNSINLSLKINRPIYSFHAGFRINPATKELGNILKKKELIDRKIALDLFEESVLELAEYSRKEGVNLLIENNVINKVNYKIFKEDPLLMTNPDEIEHFMLKMPSNVGLLFDVAHFKVSGNTLGFNVKNGHLKLKKYIKGYHLSDNDGSLDSNDCFNEDSWFWEDLNYKLNYYSIEIYRKSIAELVGQYNFVKNIIDNHNYE